MQQEDTQNAVHGSQSSNARAEITPQGGKHPLLQASSKIQHLYFKSHNKDTFLNTVRLQPASYFCAFQRNTKKKKKN